MATPSARTVAAKNGIAVTMVTAFTWCTNWMLVRLLPGSLELPDFMTFSVMITTPLVCGTAAYLIRADRARSRVEAVSPSSPLSSSATRWHARFGVFAFATDWRFLLAFVGNEIFLFMFWYQSRF